MRLGGVILCCVGIIIAVLVANQRWDTVWAAATGQTTVGGTSGGALGASAAQLSSNAASGFSPASYNAYTPGTVTEQ